jgi:fused signal recognition particle receptor
MNAFAERIKNFFGLKKNLSGEVFEELTDLLVEGDFGAVGAYRIAERLEAACGREKPVDGKGARKILAGLLEEILRKAKQLSSVPEEGLCVILLLGVNGVGKTTTAAKLASGFKERGRRPILAAGDTFRAAAIDQLKIHGERLGIRVVAHQHGGDPAAVIYDAIEAAQAGGGDLIIADTAGRMHTKSALVDELKNIDRVVESRAANVCYIKYLVLDATTGRNAVAQAEIFNQAVSLDGVIITKFDSGAKGGVVFSLAEDMGLPVAWICTGETYADIRPFDPHEYAEEYAGLR